MSSKRTNDCSITQLDESISSKLIQTEAKTVQKLEETLESLTTELSNVSQPVLEKLDSFSSLKEGIANSQASAEEALDKISNKYDNLDNKVTALHDICSSLKSLKLVEVEEKREQHREMSKQITSLTELSQHSQVLLLFDWAFSLLTFQG